MSKKLSKKIVALLVVVAASMVAMAFLLYNMQSQLTRNSYVEEMQLEAEEQQLENQQAQNDELSRVLESGSDEELIERVARDKLGYAKPNERVFVDITGK